MHLFHALLLYYFTIGELYITAFVFQYSAFLSLLVDAVTRRELAAKCDPELEER